MINNWEIKHTMTYLSNTTGSPPTDLNALTGELTPPGISDLASLKIFDDFSKVYSFVSVTDLRSEF